MGSLRRLAGSPPLVSRFPSLKPRSSLASPEAFSNLSHVMTCEDPGIFDKRGVNYLLIPHWLVSNPGDSICRPCLVIVDKNLRRSLNGYFSPNSSRVSAGGDYCTVGPERGPERSCVGQRSVLKDLIPKGSDIALDLLECPKGHRKSR